MIARSPARFLAPVAFVAFVVAAYVVVSNAGHGAKGKPRSQAVVHRHVPKVYRVRLGDGLQAISVRFGVPVPRILALNPDVDPRTLQAGHQLRLRR